MFLQFCANVLDGEKQDICRASQSGRFSRYRFSQTSPQGTVTHSEATPQTQFPQEPATALWDILHNATLQQITNPLSRTCKKSSLEQEEGSKMF